MKILHTPFLARINIRGMAIFPFIFIAHYDDMTNFTLIRHEMIHLLQQVEMFILPFFVWYLVEWLIRGIGDYKKISFEQEADAYECDPDYIETRDHYSFLKFIK